MDALALADERRGCGRAKSCGPGAPMLASSFACGDIREATVAKQARHTEESAK